MKRYAIILISVMFIFSMLILSGSFSSAKETLSNVDSLKNMYRQILTTADNNKDGKMSVDECMSIPVDKNHPKQNCLSWDDNRNGIITEDEYIKYFTAKY